MKKNIFLILLGILLIPLISADVNLEVTGFSCSPNEVVVANQFTCTATVYNSGTETADLSEVILYPDSSNWLESSSYSEVVNVDISSGASSEVVFENLRAQKSGTYGFSRIALGEAVDTYPADNNIEVNVVDIVTIVSQSANSAEATTGTVDATGQVNVGGNLDLVMSLSILSGGCSIGSQPNSASFNEVTDGQSVSYTWTITMGTSNCNYKISSVATSNPSGIASKTDSTSKTITCSGTSCVSGSSDSTTSTGGSGGGGGGGGTSTTNKSKVNLTAVIETALEFDVRKGDNVIDLDKIPSWKQSGKANFFKVGNGTIYTLTFIDFNLDKNEWLIVVDSIDEESGIVTVFLKMEDKVQAEVFAIGDNFQFDLDENGVGDLKISLLNIEDGLIDISFEKSDTFISQEKEFSKKRMIILGIIIGALVLAGIMIGLIVYFHYKKREVIKHYYKK